ncbi:GNAT family N-acetyltransferase [Rickettsiales bacterium]|nr:GNAT family N-acetyltransferase [Rickettsiales bacterium]
MRVRELKTIDEMFSAFEVISQMYPDMTKAHYEEIIPQRVDSGYRMAAVFDDENNCICCTGFWISYRFYCGKFLQMDNLVTDKNNISKGAGKEIVNWIKDLAKKENCKRIILDSYVENFDAHRFFYREGFIIRGYHLNYTL